MGAPVIVEEGILYGTIKSDGPLSGSIKTEGVLIGSLSLPVGYDDYSGSYDVTPKVKAQVMNTFDKHMTKDVTIKAIPFYEVSNQQNGETIIIGGET